MGKTLKASIFLLLIQFSSLSNAASEDECAIWICLPGGFPTSCGAAYSAMLNRLEDLKPPLPPFGECASGGNMDSNYGAAKFVPEHQLCRNNVYVGGRTYGNCPNGVTVPAHYEKGACTININSNDDIPCQPKQFIEVLDNGKLIGETYYF